MHAYYKTLNRSKEYFDENFSASRMDTKFVIVVPILAISAQQAEPHKEEPSKKKNCSIV